MQSTNLPAISDLLKPGQEVLVQIAKEPIAKKGARITSHIALPGRFLVFMPTVNHTGVSRKIESDGERRRLKEILLSEKGDAQGGFIVRTAAAGSQRRRAAERSAVPAESLGGHQDAVGVEQEPGADLSRSEFGGADSARPGYG
jgi:Rne/Rng family ribonuclease